MSPTRMEFAYRRLRKKVWDGELKPGARLVNRTLGKELGVSTVTVREALHRLASEGLVKHVPNAGAYVRDLDQKEMVDLLMLRGTLDIFTAEQAATKADERHLRRLERICEDWHETVRKMRGLPDKKLAGEALEQWLLLDGEFHAILVEAADNTWLTKVTRDINLVSRAMQTKAPFLMFDEAAATYRQHATLTRAMRARDTKSARHWMRVHGDASLGYLLKHFDDVRRHSRDDESVDQ